MAHGAFAVSGVKRTQTISSCNVWAVAKTTSSTAYLLEASFLTQASVVLELSEITLGIQGSECWGDHAQNICPQQDSIGTITHVLSQQKGCLSDGHGT